MCQYGAVNQLVNSLELRAAEIFKVLGDPVRLRLYLRIAGSRAAICVCDLGELGVSQPTVSHHLRKLREAGLVDCERRGTWVYYWALPEALEPVQELGLFSWSPATAIPSASSAPPQAAQRPNLLKRCGDGPDA